MVIVDDIPRFTDEDKDNLVIRKFSDEEYTANTTEWIRKGRKMRGIVLTIIVLIIIGIIICEKDVKYPLYAALFITAFLWRGKEVERKYEKPGALAEYYYEIFVEKKLPTVSGESYIAGTDCSLPTFYPVEGFDTTSGYRTVIYISSEEYMRLREGKTFRDKMEKDALIKLEWKFEQ